MPRTRQKNTEVAKEQPKPKKAQKKQKPAEEPKEDLQEPKKQESQSVVEQVAVKAKKYKKKTYEQQIRIGKSKYERMFLISAERSTDEPSMWGFVVQGTKGTNYHVQLSTQVRCTCPDFRFKSGPCKHIYFIVTQVAQNDELVDYFKRDRNISKNAYKILDSQLLNRLKKRIQKPSKEAKDIDLKDDTDCVICFSQMDKEQEALEDCSTCKKYFHSQCISAWKTHNPSCPLCRGALTKDGTDDDPLGKVLGIKL